jgi:predicted nuclease of predicted toxin-antitoxin system
VKALVDQNLSHRLVDLFQPRFPGSCHVRDHGLSADDDEKIWSLARDEGFFIVTKDNDFLARALVRGHPPQVVQVCVGNASTGQIAAILRDRLDSIEAFVTTATESVFLLRGAEPS